MLFWFISQYTPFRDLLIENLDFRETQANS